MLSGRGLVNTAVGFRKTELRRPLIESIKTLMEKDPRYFMTCVYMCVPVGVCMCVCLSVCVCVPASWCVSLCTCRTEVAVVFSSITLHLRF